jgi:hypothetical protein
VKGLLRKIWYWLCKKVLVFLPDRLFIELVRRITYLRLRFPYYRLNWKNPQTFNEHLNHLKVSEVNPLMQQLADKWAVREYVKQKIGQEYLIPQLKVVRDAREIWSESLPDSFIVKANHGSGWNWICKDKLQLKDKKIQQRLNGWLRQNAWYLSREPQYRFIKPMLVVEELIADEPNDYKFFCVGGMVKCIQVDYARHTAHRRSIYDPQWRKLPFHIRYQEIEQDIPPPVNLNKMFVLVDKLSEPFDFCRVDLYEVEEKIYFGEITFFPGGGHEPFHSYDEDWEFANYLGLNT